MGALAVASLIVSFFLAVVATLAWGLASTHPAPSQTALIPVFVASGGASLVMLFVSAIFSLLWLVMG